MPRPLPLVAIVGRPNVGKSTLFNRFVGHRRSITSSIPGTTRDCVVGQMTWRGHSFQVVDTGGFDLVEQDDRLQRQIQRHLWRIVQRADYLLVLCDAREGIVPLDAMLIEALRKTGVPMALVANKADHRVEVPSDCFAVGVEPTFAISALHGLGVGACLDRVVESLRGAGPSSAGGPTTVATETTAPPFAIAIVGRPNVGKSSLLNAILREERVIVNDLPGTTRDAIDTSLRMEGEPITLIDTAGLKHRRKVKSPVEFFAMARSWEALERCDVAFVMLDGTQGIVQDDKRLVEQVVARGRGVVLLVNKWDVATRVPQSILAKTVHRQLPSARCAPVLPISAKTGFGVQDCLAKARDVAHALRGVPEAELADRIRQAWTRRPPPRVLGRPVQCRDVRWFGGRSVRVHIVTRPVTTLPPAYQRYLLNQLATWPKLSGVPIRLSTGRDAALRPSVSRS